MMVFNELCVLVLIELKLKGRVGDIKDKISEQVGE